MKYNYWADGDYSVYRLPEGASTSGPAEVFQWTPLEWGPCGRISYMFTREIDPVSEAEAERVCDVIRARVAARSATP